MDRYTRHQLKASEIQSTYEQFEQFGKDHYREIVGVVLAAGLVAALVSGWRWYSDRQEASANVALAGALKTFHAYVGPAQQGLGPNSQSFASAEEKYKKAKQQFGDVAGKYPHQEAGKIAFYHVGVCQAALGDHQEAIQTLQKAVDSAGKDIAPLARYALAGELASTGKSDQAARIYQDIADHPAVTMPRATALLALADLYRNSKPQQARAIYDSLQKEFASDATLVSLVKDQLAGLPKQ